MWSGWRAVAWLGLWSLVVAAGTGLSRGITGTPEQVSQLLLVAGIEDRELRITETIDYDFVDQERHGIHRDIPQLGRAKVRASSSTAPADLTREQDGSTAKLRIGSPDEKVSGLHRYELSYPLHRGFMANKLRWDAVGTTWEVPIRRVEIWVVSDVALSDPRCFVGDEGSDTPCTIEQVGPGRLRAVVEHLGARRGITVEARASEEEVALGAAPATPDLPPPLDRSFRPALVHGLAVGGASFGMGLLILLVMAWRFRLPRIELPTPASPRGYRTPPPAALAVVDTPGEAIDVRRAAATMPPLHEPPEGLTPSRGGMLWSKGLEDRQCVAWLLERVREGALAITGTDDDFVLERRGPAVDPYHEETLETVFEEDSSAILLGGPSKRFVRLWKNVEFGLRAWSRRAKLWADCDRAQTVGSLGSVFAFVALFSAAITSAAQAPSVIPTCLGALGGALVGLVVSAELLAPYTTEGLRQWLALARFRRFLEDEGDYGDWARDHGVVDRYGAWAVALGVRRTWLEDVAPVASTPGQHHLRDLIFDGRLERLALSSGVSADRPGGSSSSSSSSGGGSVGGGAGGGGGGSW